MEQAASGSPSKPIAGEAEQLLGLMRGFVVSKTLYIAAKLGVADGLIGGPKPVDQLAKEVGANPDALYRLLRALSSVGIFEERAGRSFALTPLAHRLRRDVPGSLRSWVLTNGGPIYGAFTEALHGALTGQPAFPVVFGMSFFDYLRETPEEGDIFNSAMREFTAQANQSLLAAYDFRGIRQVVDVGGGDGALIQDLLNAYPEMGGVIFDLPHVVAAARSSRDFGRFGERIRLIGGDVFQEIPSGADLYLLTWILHDWDDDRAKTILENCRHAMPSHARLLVVEAIVPEGNEPHFSKFGDIVMMVLFGSRERTEAEYRRLLEASGFTMTRVLTTASPRSILEAIPASR